MRGGKVIALWFFNISERRVAMLSWFSFANATKSTWIYRCGLLTPWQWYSSRWLPGQLGLGTPSCFWMWIAHTWIQKISFDDFLSIPWGFECPTFDLEMVEDPCFKKNDQGWKLGKLIVLQVCLEFTLGWKGSFCDGSWNNQHTQWMWIPQQYPAKFHIGGTDLHVVSFDSVSMQSVASSTLSSLGLTWEELFNASCGLLVCQSPCWIF